MDHLIFLAERIKWKERNGKKDRKEKEGKEEKKMASDGLIFEFYMYVNCLVYSFFFFCFLKHVALEES